MEEERFSTTYSFVIWEPSSEYSTPLRSEEFAIKGTEPLLWRINIRHEKKKAKGKSARYNYAMLYLSLSNRNYSLSQFDFPVKVKFSIQHVRNGNDFGSLQKDGGGKDLIHIGCQMLNTISTGQFHRMNLITSYCTNDLNPSIEHIAINLEFRNRQISDVVDILMLDDPEHHANSLARRLKDETEHRDYTIVVAGKEFYAHKVVLAVQCPYFAGLLRSRGQESQQNRVELQDIDPEIFEILLHFIYTGEVKDMQKHAWQLVQAADRFMLDELKNRCVLVLYKHLNVETVCNTLIIADQHSLAHLKEQAFNFIRDNCSAVKKTKGFETLTTNHTKLAMELLTHMMDSV